MVVYAFYCCIYICRSRSYQVPCCTECSSSTSSTRPTGIQRTGKCIPVYTRYDRILSTQSVKLPELQNPHRIRVFISSTRVCVWLTSCLVPKIKKTQEAHHQSKHVPADDTRHLQSRTTTNKPLEPLPAGLRGLF